jgi:hypothetical protein
VKRMNPGVVMKGGMKGGAFVDPWSPSSSAMTATSTSSERASASKSRSLSSRTRSVSRARGGSLRQGRMSGGSRTSGTGKDDSAKNNAMDGGRLAMTIARWRVDLGGFPPRA